MRIEKDDRYERKLHNERTKLTANAFNAISIALVGAGFVIPVIANRDLGALLRVDTWIWIAAGVGLHFGARAMLGALKPEE